MMMMTMIKMLLIKIESIVSNLILYKLIKAYSL